MAKGNPRGSGYARNANDWYVEPPWAVADFLNVETFDGPIWDPACGRGTIPLVAQRRGIEAIGTDLVDRGFGTQFDFLRCRQAPARNMICNPPFNVIGPWIARALDLCPGRVAIFAELRFLQGIKRGRWLQRTPLSDVWVYSYRVPCPPGEEAPPIDAWPRDAIKGGFIAFAWFVWTHGHVGPWRGHLLPTQPDARDLLS